MADTPISQIVAFAAMGVAFLSIFGVFAVAATVSRNYRNYQRDTHNSLVKQCKRDQFRDKVVIQALRDAQGRARASIPPDLMKTHDGALVNERLYQIGLIQYTIDQLQTQYGKCLKDLP